jgi:hypothetical protein
LKKFKKEKGDNMRTKIKADKTYYYRIDLDKVKGAVFIGWSTSVEGYTILYFKRGKQTIAVFLA